MDNERNRVETMATAYPNAYKPFKPEVTIDDVRRREDEIRAASIAAYKEEAERSREELSKKHKQTTNEQYRISSGCYELMGRLPAWD